MLTQSSCEIRKIVLDHSHDEVAQQWDDVLATFPHPQYEIVPTVVVYDAMRKQKIYYGDTGIAFPGRRYEMIGFRHTEDAVMTESFLLGTHRGPFGAILATGNAFRVRGTAFFVFEGETLTTERIYFDVLMMLRKLFGVLDYRKPSTWLLLIETVRSLRSIGAYTCDMAATREILGRAWQITISRGLRLTPSPQTRHRTHRNEPLTCQANGFDGSCEASR